MTDEPPTVPVPEPFQDLDAVVALAIQEMEAASPLRGVDAIAVRAIVALSHAGVAITTCRERHRGVKIPYTGDPRALARELIADVRDTREVEQ